jgi:hypothetical protein
MIVFLMSREFSLLSCNHNHVTKCIRSLLLLNDIVVVLIHFLKKILGTSFVCPPLPYRLIQTFIIIIIILPHHQICGHSTCRLIKTVTNYCAIP